MRLKIEMLWWRCDDDALSGLASPSHYHSVKNFVWPCKLCHVCLSVDWLCYDMLMRIYFNDFILKV